MACPADEALAAWSAGEIAAAERAQIEDHAAACPRCREIALALAGVVPHGVQSDIGAEGATIGRYDVLGSIGSGAMGVVLRARDPMLDREVAIKMVNSAHANAETRARMLAEAQTLARIDHPNVVRVYDAGEFGEEVFVAMALVTGPTLAQWLAEAPRELAACLDVLRGVAAGISAVHEVGLVHRDIKPDNIIVHDGTGVLVDLGLAKPEVGAAGSGIAGTVRYLAPEVRRGARANAASDQFAWWTVVDDTLQRATMSARRRRRLARVLARGRAEDPASRYASLAEACSALVAAAAPRRRAWWLAAPAALALGAFLLLPRTAEPDACAAALPASWLLQRPAVSASVTRAGADAPRILAELDARARRYSELRAQSCRSARSVLPDEHTHALREQLCIDESWNTTDREVVELQQADREAVRDAIDALINVLPLERCAGDTIPAVAGPPPATSALESRQLLASIRAIRSASDQNPTHRLERLRELEGPVKALDYARVTIAWHAALGAELAARGDVEGARKELETQLALGESAGDDETRTRALVDLYSLSGVGGVRDPALRKSAEAAVARLGSPTVTAELKMRESIDLVNRGDLAGGLAAIREAVRLCESVAIDAHEQTVDATTHLALIQQASGDVKTARTTLQRARELALRRYAPDDRRVLELRGLDATMLLDLHEFAAARQEFADVLAGLAPALHDTPFMTTSNDGLCEADLELGDLTSAKQACDTALAFSQRVWGPDAPLTYEALLLVGRQRVASQHGDEAIAVLERALSIAEHSIPGRAEPRAMASGYLALALHATHRDPARARALARDAKASLADTPGREQLVAQLRAAFPR